jgi:hypothetical protein
MMKYVSRLLAVGLLCVHFNIYADDTVPNDVKGWGDTRWGMTPNEAKTILANQWNVSGEEVLIIENHEIFGYKSVARLDFRKDNRLSRLAILIRETGEHVSEEDAHSALHKIRTSLTSQYGEGQVIKDLKESAYIAEPGVRTTGQEQVEIKWKFPSSIIILRYTFAGALSIGPITQDKHLTVFIKYDENTDEE